MANFGRRTGGLGVLLENDPDLAGVPAALAPVLLRGLRADAAQRPPLTAWLQELEAGTR